MRREIFKFMFDTIFQAGQSCSPEGRNCIEEKKSLDFNCSVTCEGVYAGIEWGEEREKENLNKILTLSTEYKRFKKRNFQHFRFNSSSMDASYGRLLEQFPVPAIFGTGGFLLKISPVDKFSCH